MQEKIKLCYIVSSLANEGPVNVMYNIIKYIDFEKYEVFVITLREEKEESIIKKFEILPISIIMLKIKSRIVNLPKIFFVLKQSLKEIQPLIIHTHCPRSLFLAVFLPSYYKKLHTIHNFPGIVDKAIYGFLKGTIVSSLMIWALKKIDKPIACARNIKDLLFKEHGIVVQAIKNGVDFQVYKKDEKQKKKMRLKLGLSLSKKYFVFLGRFSYEKNPEFIVKAFSALERSDIELIMLGVGPLLDILKENNYNNIIYTGFKNNVREYLIASDYFVSSSRTEGMPNSVLEAMSVGLPLLLSDIPAHREIINDKNSNFGFLFDINRSSDFNLQLEKLLSLPIDSTAALLKNYFVENYTAEKMSLLYQNEYASILKK